MQENGDEVQAASSTSRRRRSSQANPAYEEMEGIVAGVPRLAQYDVDIDAGSDGIRSGERGLVHARDAAGRDAEAARQPVLPHRDGAVRDEPRPARRRRAGRRRRRQGRVRRGHPRRRHLRRDARASSRRRPRARLADAEAFEPTPSDAFTAITIMTPTMSEYFEAWKNSRFIAGEDAEELGFVATSRLSDIADILSGIAVHLRRDRADDRRGGRAQAEQTGAAAR